MDNNMISNPKVETSTGMGLNDKDYITNLNSCLKEMVKNYAIAMTEASNEKLFQIYKNIYINIALLQREVYELMFGKGWYVIERSTVQKVTQKFDALNQEYQDIMQ